MVRLISTRMVCGTRCGVASVYYGEESETRRASFGQEKKPLKRKKGSKKKQGRLPASLEVHAINKNPNYRRKAR